MRIDRMEEWFSYLPLKYLKTCCLHMAWVTFLTNVLQVNRQCVLWISSWVLGIAVLELAQERFNGM